MGITGNLQLGGGGGVATQQDVDNITTNQNNIALNALRQIVTLTQYNDSIADAFDDETGVDNATSANELYDATNDKYYPSGGGTADIIVISNAADTSTTFADLTSNGTPTVVANTEHSTDVTDEFGGATSSIRFDGSSGLYFSGGDYDVGTGQCYCEAWIRIDNTTGIKTIAGNYASVDGWQFRTNGTSLQIIFNATAITGGTLSANTWHHVAWSRNSSNLVQLYIDGTRVTSSTNSTNLSSGSSVFDIGATDSGTNQRMTGYISGVVFENGTPGIYTGTSYTVPTSDPSFQADDITLVSNSVTAESTPTDARVVFLLENTGALTIGTDIKAYASRDGGTTFTEVTITDEGQFSSTVDIISCPMTDISSQPSGTSMVWKIQTFNNKSFFIHGVWFQWL